MEWSAEQAIFNSGINTQKVDSGTAILLNQSLIKFGPYRKDCEGRIISTEIHCDIFKVQIINVDGYTAAYPKNKRENFFKQFYNFVNPNLPVILCGDFNNVKDPTRDRWPEKNSNRSESKQLSELIELCKLQDSLKTFDPVGAKFTFCSQATKSRIDRIYASTKIRLISIEVLPNQFSDHQAVITHFEITLPVPRGKSYWKNNASVFYDEKFLGNLETNWNIWKTKVSDTNIIQWWLDTKPKIKKLVIQHSRRIKNEYLANENNLKQKLNKLAIEPDSTRNTKAYLDAKKSLARLQIAETKKKLIRNQHIYQYSSNFSTKEFFKDFMKKREQTYNFKINR